MHVRGGLRCRRVSLTTVTSVSRRKETGRLSWLKDRIGPVGQRERKGQPEQGFMVCRSTSTLVPNRTHSLTFRNLFLPTVRSPRTLAIRVVGSLYSERLTTGVGRLYKNGD